MPLFPAFLKLTGRLCVVVGAGAVAEAKIESLLTSGARVRVVAPAATDKVRSWADDGRIVWEARPYDSRDLEGATLVIAATSAADVHEQIFRHARQQRVLCNVVDDPDRCDFYFPAVVRRGPLQLAISTEGKSPALAQRLRRELEEQFGPEWEDWVDRLGSARRKLFRRSMDSDRRRRLLHRLARRLPLGGLR